MEITNEVEGEDPGEKTPDTEEEGSDDDDD